MSLFSLIATIVGLLIMWIYFIEHSITGSEVNLGDADKAGGDE
jgi:hypothetical protein